MYLVGTGNGKKGLRYNITAGTWNKIRGLPGSLGSGGASATDGINLYVLRGNKSNTFWRYNVASDIWSSLPNALASIDTGSGLAYLPDVALEARAVAIYPGSAVAVDGDTIQIRQRITAGQNNSTVTPTLTVLTANGATATLSGPSPASAVIPANTFVDFFWTATVTAGSTPGDVRFFAAVPDFPEATSASVLVTQPLTFQATVNDPAIASGVIRNTGMLSDQTDFYSGVSSNTTQTFLGNVIGDFVWQDTDGDGIQDPGEPGIPGVIVWLYDDTGTTLIASTTTDSTGYYSFGGLENGTYVVRYDSASLPPGFVPTTPSSITSDPLLNDNTVYLDADFGFQPPPALPGSIGDLVWSDLNGDGIKQAFEAGIAGVTVTLYRDLNNNGTIDSADALFQTILTDSSGGYLFTGLPAGDYLVSVSPTDPAIPVNGSGFKFVATTEVLYDVTLAAGGTFLDADFGFAPPASIGDFVFFDTNANGSQDIGEPGIPDVTVRLYLDADNDGSPDGSHIATTVTADGTGLYPAGFYEFTGLPAGTYFVQVDTTTLPTGVVLTADPDRDGVPVWDDSDPTLPPGDDADSHIIIGYGSSYTGADFGYQPPGSIGDFVWLDLNGDGIQDPGELGIANVEITITNGTDTYTTTTDWNGYWSWPNLPDGTWTVTASGDALAGLVPTYDAEGAPDGSATFVVLNGDVQLDVGNLGIDFGYKLDGLYSLSGTILTNDKGPDDKPGYVLGSHDDIDDFFDDGVDMDAGPFDETELDGITVYLYTESGTFLGTTVSADGGKYSFPNLSEGTYRVIIGTTDPVFDDSTVTTTVDNNPATTSVENTGTSVIQTVEVASNVTDVDFAFIPNSTYDYGDLPLSYGMTTLAQDGARHAIPVGGSTVFLGNAPDAESDGLPSAFANGDDLMGADDEDGVLPLNIGSWTNGNVVDENGGSIRFSVTGSGWLVGWVDWNGDGDFLDPGEMIVSQSVTTGTVDVAFDIPAGTITGEPQSWLSRFRIFTA